MELKDNNNLITRICPTYLLPYLKLSRIDNPIGSWLLIIPCWLGSSLALMNKLENISLQDLWTPIACFIGGFVMRGAGCTWNDINDHKFDMMVERTKERPIPSGQVTIKNAIVWLFIQLFFGFLILITFDFRVILIGILSLIPVGFYPFAKRITWWPQFFLGVAFNWGIIFAYFSHTNKITLQVILLYFGGIIWTLFYDTIYAHQDLKDDELIGVKSTARLFGKLTKFWLSLFSFSSCLFILLAFYYENGNIIELSFIPILIGTLIFFLHLNLQIYYLKIDCRLNCLKLFKSNKDAGFLFLFCFLIHIILEI